MSQPVIKIKDGKLSVAVFKQLVNSQFGQRNSYGCVLQRNYQKDGQWIREEFHFYKDDMLKIANLLNKAYNEILSEDADKKTTEPSTTVTSDEDSIPF